MLKLLKIINIMIIRGEKMTKLFTKEQARNFIRENNLKDGKSIEDAFIEQIKDVLQEALEEEMNSELGYSKY
ncbi:MAG: hypothetical protein DRN66_04105, partial [Candidatus Nanohalarchaeota archaeon]